MIKARGTNPYLGADTADLAASALTALGLGTAYEAVSAAELRASNDTYVDYLSRDVLCLRSEDDVRKLVADPNGFPYDARIIRLRDVAEP